MFIHLKHFRLRYWIGTLFPWILLLESNPEKNIRQSKVCKSNSVKMCIWSLSCKKKFYLFTTTGLTKDLKYLHTASHNYISLCILCLLNFMIRQIPLSRFGYHRDKRAKNGPPHRSVYLNVEIYCKFFYWKWCSEK